MFYFHKILFGDEYREEVMVGCGVKEQFTLLVRHYKVKIIFITDSTEQASGFTVYWTTSTPQGRIFKNFLSHKLF